MGHIRIACLTALLLAIGLQPALADESVRIATYNIKYLDTDLNDDRREKLETVLEQLDAQVIGLQEIDDRAALEVLFDPDDWYLIIDDDSGRRQDVAVAIRRPLRPVGVADDLDADDGDFLFPDSAHNDGFPERRDALAVTVRTPHTGSEFTVIVIHAKSRVGDRDETDRRRNLASSQLIDLLAAEWDERDYVLLGDFNDTPDDRSANILETGNPNAMAGMENEQGAFLVNLTEPLMARDMVSHGLNSADVDADGRLDPVAPGSRALNDANRGEDVNVGRILFDQIFIPVGMLGNYIHDSAAVFAGGDAAVGNKIDRASDHVPVYADFVFAEEDEGGEAGLVIAAALPNPEGTDANNEQVRLHNGTDADIDLDGWRLVDRAENEFDLAGTIGAGAEIEVLLSPHTMPLNNSGDEIRLLDPDGLEVGRKSYTKSQVHAGVWVVLP